MAFHKVPHTQQPCDSCPLWDKGSREISCVGSDPQTCRTRAMMENHTVSPETSRTVVGSARVPLTWDEITNPSVWRVKGGRPHKAENLGPAIGVSRTCLQRELLHRCGNIKRTHEWPPLSDSQANTLSRAALGVSVPWPVLPKSPRAPHRSCAIPG